MNLCDKILICTFLFAIIVWQSLHQAHLFRLNKPISHFWKGMAYAAGVAIITTPYVMVYDWWYLIKIPVIGISIRLAFFDFTLNMARHKPLFYNGAQTTGSLIDKIENSISKEFRLILKIIYVVIFITLIVFIK